MNNRYINHLDEMFTILMRSDYVPYDEIKKMKNVTGVYAVYSPECQLIYIGSTKNFKDRFGKHFRNESTHTLLRTFLKRKVFNDCEAAVEYISTKCRFLIRVCKTKREAEALEHFAIWAKNPKYNQ